MKSALLVVLYVLPSVLILVFLTLFKLRGAGFWRSLERSASLTSKVSVLYYVLAAIVIRGESVWIFLLIAIASFFFFYSIAAVAKLIANATKSPDTASNEETRRLRAARDTRFYPENAPPLPKPTFSQQTEEYFRQAEAVTGRPLQTKIQRLDHFVEQVETLHDVGEAVAGDGDLSPGAMSVFTLSAFYFVLLEFSIAELIGHGKGPMFFVELLVCGIAGFILADWTWKVLPASIRLTSRVLMFFWPATLVLLYLLLKN